VVVVIEVVFGRVNRIRFVLEECHVSADYLIVPVLV